MKIEKNYYDELQKRLHDFDQSEAARKTTMTQEELEKEEEAVRQECQAFLASLPKKPPTVCDIPEEELERRYQRLEHAATWLGELLYLNVTLERTGATDVQLTLNSTFFAIDDLETKFCFRQLLKHAKGLFIQKDGSFIQVSFTYDLCDVT